MSFSIQKRWDAAIDYVRDLISDSEADVIVGLVEDAKHESRLRLYIASGVCFVLGVVIGGLLF